MSFKDWKYISAYKEKIVEEFYDPESNEVASSFDKRSMLFDSISRIMGAVTAIEKSTGDIFKLDQSAMLGTLILGEKQAIIVSAVAVDYSELERELLLFKVTPYVKVFRDCYRDIRPKNPRVLKRSELPNCFSDLNRFVGMVRDRICSGEFKRELSAHLRVSNKNYLGLVNYIDGLFSLRSRILVLRIDFSYGKGKVEIEGRVNSSDRLNLLCNVTERIARHRIELISYLKQKCPELGLLGYVWKLEYGREKGHHYHMMFFLDGAKVRQDVVIAKRIGEYWNKTITKGEGVYFNCNRNKERYKHCGVGMICHNETEKLINLKERAAIYLTKADRYVSACMPTSKRTFGKGALPKLKTRSAGRPRGSN
ncbi:MULTISPECIES: inovirus-type Gp2 protein [Pseudomonas syringae group]|uniref:Inovirus Gp2 family protein n=1 Tax=Pseudomonas coronafaciens pv. coronafaciens TaxID=235275 RepID=A0AAE6UQY7_9PSED|nr:inovirus-type Gp2 protein [Pseudomonas coronafaciens]QGT83788.1 inovirus Gp2 family protein [Pseudomonas coronafaciens pv. coronafaciens]RMV88553.1 hypothetical protein ALP02_200020 [Pseudomonas coronafaciens pv. garcae]